MRTERVVDSRTAHLEVAVDLIFSRNGGNHRLRLCMSQAFVVEEEERFVMNDWTTERTAKVIAHEVIRLVHLVERARVEDVVAEELLSGAVKLVRAATRDDVDLTADVVIKQKYDCS